MSEIISQDEIEFKKLCDVFTRSKTPLEIEYFVVGRHENRVWAYRQLCMQFDEKFMALREAEYNLKIARIDLAEHHETYSVGAERQQLKIDKKVFDIEHLEHLIIGAKKDLKNYLEISKAEFADLMELSEEELYALGEKDYWVSRLSRQIQSDFVVYGQIQLGNLDAILKMPRRLQKEIIKQATLRANEYISLANEVNRELLESNDHEKLPLLSVERTKRNILPASASPESRVAGRGQKKE